MIKHTKYILLIIIFLGFLLRVLNINWDNGNMFHPDERAIIMTVDGLSYPANLSEFLSPESSFNPDFFAYGNFPMYTLKILSDGLSFVNPTFSEYGGMHLAGRLLNTIFDVATIFLIYLFGKRLFSKKIGLLSAFFYSVAVFPIQNSHFFTVDISLTFFTILTLFLLDNYIEKPFFRYALLTGASFGLALATKVSILPLVFIIFLGFTFAHLNDFKSFSLKKFLRQLLNIVFLFISSAFVFIATQPYVLIDFNDFYTQIKQQSTMGSDPFVFPYTLQYVGKIPVYYEFKNILLFGLGIPIGVFAFLGIIYITLTFIRNYKSSHRIMTFFIFFWIYFLLVSNYAVGWMRYLLPIYPILAIGASIFCVKILFPLFSRWINIKKKKILTNTLLIFFIVISSLWTFSFLNIYIEKNTKLEATDWIHNNIEQGKTIAVEHWDDRLPVYGSHEYDYSTLPLYDPETKTKWNNINKKLNDSDYLIIASNRLYEPLTRLTNCEVLPQNRCYPKTANYYDNLFSGKSEFEKVREFTSHPTIPILNIEINDQSADESFTVYDHPRIMIFKKK